MIEWLNDWMIEWLNDWMIEWLNAISTPFKKKKMTWGIVSSGIQSMVNDAFLLFNDVF